MWIIIKCQDDDTFPLIFFMISPGYSYLINDLLVDVRFRSYNTPGNVTALSFFDLSSWNVSSVKHKWMLHCCTKLEYNANAVCMLFYCCMIYEITGKQETRLFLFLKCHAFFHIHANAFEMLPSEGLSKTQYALLLSCSQGW